ncbi:MAG: pyroglutamyl-peptidase I [Firmicutes bacterium]|nr:pyroglutamyl-peptidase I [Bacillota bacterium]
MVKNVLLTGFEPFGGEKINPSWEVVKNVKERKIEGATIEAVQLPCVYNLAVKEAIKKIRESEPCVVISLGQAGGRPDISIERVALNVQDATIADNAGNKRTEERINQDSVDAYFSTLPLTEIVDVLRDNNIPVRISNSAGTYVCNDLMYGVLEYIKREELRTLAGFIHVPYLPEQAVKHPGTASMSLDLMEQALELIIKIALKYI